PDSPDALLTSPYRSSILYNLELTFKSEINVGSRLSEKRRLKRRITKSNTTRGEPSACAKEEANLNQNGDREERRKRYFRACKQQATTAFPPLRASLKRAFSAASHCRINNGSDGLDEQPSLEKNSEKPCHLERNWLLTYF
ncbi:hypothetical protein LINPERPRIM_LOCUS44237, partial [Linum perenne]